MAQRTVVVSPHFDDAVLSCWHVLEAGDTVVVNVFGGVPERGAPGWWDRLTRAVDSPERVRERRREDEAALALAGTTSLTLDLLDEQYRRNGRPPAPAEALAEHVRDAAAVYVPAGFFLGTDHQLVRQAALELRPDARIYADHPHAGIWGLPSWVTGEAGDGSLDVDAAWRQSMEDAGIDLGSLHPEVHTLDDESFARKLEAVRCYRTQVEALEREAPLEQLRWEVAWTR
jgi:LmbE family N-acetylglucosaminyl deacetylase